MKDSFKSRKIISTLVGYMLITYIDIKATQNFGGPENNTLQGANPSAKVAKIVLPVVLYRCNVKMHRLKARRRSQIFFGNKAFLGVWGHTPR